MGSQWLKGEVNQPIRSLVQVCANFGFSEKEKTLSAFEYVQVSGCHVLI